VWVKICGITSLQDAELAIAAGADAIGLNCVPSSPRAVSGGVAKNIVERCQGRVEVIGVVANLRVEEALAVREMVGFSYLQLHGDEAPRDLAMLLPRAYKAVRIGDENDVRLAEAFGGERLLVDAKVHGMLGGTGERVDLGLVTELARRRRVVLAGGLNAANVAEAVSRIRPFGVDVASGVETAEDPRKKDPAKLAAFVREARRDTARERA
jgi:phosphoribosylanthranilate isomerase